MALVMSSAPFGHQSYSVGQIMRQVIYALIPAVSLCVWFFGLGIVVQILLGVATALITETLMLYLRERPIKIFINDFSAILTAILLAVAIPPYSPWWMIVLGVSFSLVFAKHLYGGLGFNPFNPAMIGYAVLLISFPREMTNWTMFEIDKLFDVIFFGFGHNDAHSGATALDAVKTYLKQNLSLVELFKQPMWGLLSLKQWEWVSLAYLIGGIYLIYKKIITWHTPLAILSSLFVMAMFFNLWQPQLYPSGLFHLFSGATMLGAFFIATDPVTSATSNRGKLVYGAGIGLIIYIIRTWGNYPDGMAFGVLLMNLAASTIDYYTKPPFFGEATYKKELKK